MHLLLSLCPLSSLFSVFSLSKSHFPECHEKKNHKKIWTRVGMGKTVPKKVGKGTVSAHSSSLALVFQKQTANTRAVATAEQTTVAVTASEQLLQQQSPHQSRPSTHYQKQERTRSQTRTILVHPPRKHASPRLELPPCMSQVCMMYLFSWKQVMLVSRVQPDPRHRN